MNSLNFYSDKGQSSGWKPECRDCTLAIKKIYYQNNKQKLKQRSADYRAANPETWKQVKSSYRKRNPEKVMADRRARYARRFGGNHKFYSVAEVLELYGSNCHLCGLPIDLKAPRQAGKPGYEMGLHVDHVIRLADGGDDILENVRPAHAICNQRKG
jgi:5-methylcytosine-specific restriction endonuclease McrA